MTFRRPIRGGLRGRGRKGASERGPLPGNRPCSRGAGLPETGVSPGVFKWAGDSPSQVAKLGNVLVTGGAGFIGSNLLKELVEDSKVFVIDNLNTGNVLNIDPYMKKIQLQVLDTEDIFQVDFVPQVIFHLGMYSSTPMYKENRNLVRKVVDGTIQVLEFAKRHNAGVVLASSSSIYNGHPVPQSEDMVPMITDFYTEARLYAERLAELYTKMFA